MRGLFQRVKIWVGETWLLWWVGGAAVTVAVIVWAGISDELWPVRVILPLISILGVLTFSISHLRRVDRHTGKYSRRVQIDVALRHAERAAEPASRPMKSAAEKEHLRQLMRNGRLDDIELNPLLLHRGSALSISDQAVKELIDALQGKHAEQNVGSRDHDYLQDVLAELAADLYGDSSVYISEDDPTEVLAALTELGEVYGFTIEPAGEIKRGSWFRRFRFKPRPGIKEKLADLANKVERAAELHTIYQVRSQNDEREANAVARLIEALGDNDSVIQLSSLLVIKTGDKIVARVLTEQEIKHLNDNPALLSEPRAILDALTEKLSAPADSAPGRAQLNGATDSNYHAEVED